MKELRPYQVKTISTFLAKKLTKSLTGSRKKAPSYIFARAQNMSLVKFEGKLLARYNKKLNRTIRNPFV